VFERFTERARRVLVLAQEEARLLDHGFIGTEHILLGLIQEVDGIAAQALRELDISLKVARAKVAETVGAQVTSGSGSPPFTPRAKKVLELALREALQLGHSYIGTEHLLLGVVREGEGVGAQVLVSLGADLSAVRQHVIRLLAEAHGVVPSAVDAGLSPRPRAAGFRRTGLVACSFCGLAPPEAGQLIAGDNAFICERCVGQWFGRLEAGPKQHRPIVSHFAATPHEGPPAEGPGAPSPGRPEVPSSGRPEVSSSGDPDTPFEPD
jgi:hypothetical protein